MARVHRLKHVERLGSAALADDDSVGTHAQRVAEEVADSDLSRSLDIRRPRLETHDVRLIEEQFGRVFDRDDSFGIRQKRRENVEEGRLSGAGSAADYAVEPRLNATRRKSIATAGTAPILMRSSAVSRFLPKRRIVNVEPSIETGSMIALTREPSGSRASTIGEDSSIRRPSGVMIRSMISRSCSSR